MATQIPVVGDRFDLLPGPEHGKGSAESYEHREELLKATVAHYLPDFVRAVETHRKAHIDLLMIHQDAFASGLHVDEYVLLGLAIKYAGLFGLTVNMNGTNGETCGPEHPRGKKKSK